MNKKKKNAFRDRIISGLEGLSPNTLVPETPETFDEPVNIAYCPLLKGKCSNVNCGDCSLIESSFSDYIWVCSNCVHPDLVPYPFWSDGCCEVCGFRSPVLILLSKPALMHLPED